MALRALLLASEAATTAAEALRAKLHVLLGVDASVVALAGRPHTGPIGDFVLLHLKSISVRAAISACLSASRSHPSVPILAVCDGKLATSAAEIASSGIQDFLFEPYSDEELCARLRRIAGPSAAMHTESVKTPASSRVAHNLIGSDPKFLEQVDKLSLFAGCDADVLILGETGTGKEIFAQAVHYTSARAAWPCVAISCGAIPNDLIEDELFGHIRGAYTTAHASRTGLVKEAEGGSLFLDDVDCLPLVAQTKLLRFLQEREYRAVGSNTTQHADVRVIAASNRDLRLLAARGEFRQDLYYRLNVLALSLPSLRERREDIPALALHFVRQFAHQHRRPVSGVSAAALRSLLVHDWPGNVRELQHAIERGVLLARGTVVDATDIELAGVIPAAPIEESFRTMKARLVEDFERGYIGLLLSANHGNVTHAARAAGKNRRAFFELMRKYCITSDAYRAGDDRSGTPRERTWTA